MKKTLIMLGACAAIVSCTNSDSGNNQDTISASDQATASRQTEVDTSINNIGTDRTADAPPSAASYQKGAQLISSSDCLSCHKEDEKLVGPSYKDVAKKYEATESNINYLAGKIMKGGSGAWGEIPMPPHPALSEADAKEMANYILSLK